MKYLLDTCVVSELVKPAPDQCVLYWLDNAHAEDLFLSALTIGELRKGIVKLPTSRKKEQLNTWLNNLLKEYSNRIFSVNTIVAESWGMIQGAAEKNGMPMSSIDGMIAATAYMHSLIIVTRNEKDFVASQMPVINPWKK